MGRLKQQHVNDEPERDIDDHPEPDELDKRIQQLEETLERTRARFPWAFREDLF